MFFNPRSLFSAALVSFFAFDASALDLQPLSDPSDILNGHPSRRAAAPAPLDLIPIEDPSVLTHGRSLKRTAPGYGCFDPSSESKFFWGAYAGDNIYLANFTLSHPGDDEYILPVENFAKELKSINCGSGKSPMVLEFTDKASFEYAKSAWDWVNKEDINSFTLVTEPNQCYDGDNRSPYLVSAIKFDDSKLVAQVSAQEKEWHEIAHTFHLHLGHQYIDPTTANVTHPHLKREESTMDISHSFKQNLFNFGKDSSETAGLALSADADITTGGHIIADFDIERKWGIIPKDININIHPQGVNAAFMLTLNADGTLGKGLDWTMKPEIEIPVGALNIKGVLEIGPFVTMGVHFGSSSLEGTASITTGARATVDDAATVQVKLRNPDENSISGWTPSFEKVEPQFSAEIGGNLRAWVELGIEIKAEAFGKWGYQASVDAQLPYFEATLAAKLDSLGVCGTQKTKGVDLGASVGINVNLNAGEVEKAPTFQKDLFETSWPLFSTCMGVGPDDVQTPTPTPEPTSEATVEPTTAEPTGGPIETGSPNATVSNVTITQAHTPIVTPYSTGIIGTGTAGTGSAGYPITGNSTFLTMASRRPTAVYF